MPVYSLIQIGGIDIDALLNQLTSKSIKNVNVVINSFLSNKKQRHWTAASILYPNGLDKPIIIFMNSLQHAPKEGLIKALEYISTKTNSIFSNNP